MALEGYTTHAAWSVAEDEVAGTLEVGKRADLTAFAVDPLVAPPDELVEAPIVLTVVDGAVSHRAAQVGGCRAPQSLPVSHRALFAGTLDQRTS